MNIIYNKELLAKYDNDFYKEYLFVEELNENDKYTPLKHTRKVISCNDLSKYIYLSTLNICKNEYGILLKCASVIIYLNKVGDNIYYISYIEGTDHLAIYSILHTFMMNNNCFIDINKYSHLFIEYLTIYLHKEIFE